MLRGLGYTLLLLVVLAVIGVSAYYLTIGYAKTEVAVAKAKPVSNIVYQGQYASPQPLVTAAPQPTFQPEVDFNRSLTREEIGTTTEVETASYVMDPSIRAPVNFVATGRLGGYAEVAPREGFEAPSSKGQQVKLTQRKVGFTTQPRTIADYLNGDRMMIEQSVEGRPSTVRSN